MMVISVAGVGDQWIMISDSWCSINRISCPSGRPRSTAPSQWQLHVHVHVLLHVGSSA